MTEPELYASGDLARLGFGPLPEPPPWQRDAYDLYAAVVGAGLRPTRFRLTEQQAKELRDYTGRDDLLLGRPTVIRPG